MVLVLVHMLCAIPFHPFSQQLFTIKAPLRLEMQIICRLNHLWKHRQGKWWCAITWDSFMSHRLLSVCLHLWKDTLKAAFNRGKVWVFQHTVGKEMCKGGRGGGVYESFRKILHTSACCAAVTRSRSATMRSFVPKIGMHQIHVNTHTHTWDHPLYTHRHINTYSF